VCACACACVFENRYLLKTSSSSLEFRFFPWVSMLSLPPSLFRAHALSLFPSLSLVLAHSLSDAWTSKQDTTAKSVYESVTPFTKKQHSKDRIVTRLVIPPMHRQGKMFLKVCLFLNIFASSAFLGGLVQATSVGRFRRHHCSTLINYNSNLSMRNTFLKKMLPLPDNRELLPTPKETYDLILSAVTLRFWSFRTPNIDFLY